MIAASLIALVVGLVLSALFSGTETGFYRVNRVRLVLTAMEGDWVARGLLRLANAPGLFVGTSLLGNNLANYVISFAAVVVLQSLTEDAWLLEAAGPLAMTPAIFVFGELVPKQLFFLAPNRLLRRFGAVYLAFFALFLPVVLGLYWLGRQLERVLGQSPQKVRLALARRELEQVMQEGQQAGVLHPAQWQLAQNFFLIAARPVAQTCQPIARVPSLPRGASVREAIRFAQRHRLTNLVVQGPQPRQVAGYVRTADLLLASDPEGVVGDLRPTMRLAAQEHTGEALLRMSTARCDLAVVADAAGQALGVLQLDPITQSLVRPEA